MHNEQIKQIIKHLNIQLKPYEAQIDQGLREKDVIALSESQIDSTNEMS